MATNDTFRRRRSSQFDEFFSKFDRPVGIGRAASLAFHLRAVGRRSISPRPGPLPRNPIRP